MRRSRSSGFRCIALLAMLGLGLGGCRGTDGTAGRATGTSPAARAAVRAVLDADAELGRIRNHDPETMPIARAVERYVAGLDALEMDACPEGFRSAMRAHRDAWDDSVSFFERFPDERGEMHDLFERIRGRDPETRAALEVVEQGIWGTWAEVEAASTP